MNAIEIFREVCQFKIERTTESLRESLNGDPVELFESDLSKEYRNAAEKSIYEKCLELIEQGTDLQGIAAWLNDLLLGRIRRGYDRSPLQKEELRATVRVIDEIQELIKKQGDNQ